MQSLDPAWGGIARVLPALAMELARAGESCRIATLAGGRFGTPGQAEGCEILTFSSSGGGLGKSADFDRRVGELVAESDVVHLHGLWTGQNWSAGKAARRAGKPYIMTPHSMMMPWAWKRSWWKKRPIGWLFEHGNLRHASRLHALAEGEAQEIRSLGFNERIEVIPNGIHVEEFRRLPSRDLLCERFGQLEDKRWLLILGRIHPQKGIIQGMQACFDVLAEGKDWHLIVAGPDEIGIRGALEAAVLRKGAKDRVTFTGMLDRQEVLSALAGASLLLQPSMSEGLSMSIIEALAAGVPVVISPNCNMPEVEARGAGCIVPSERRPIAAALKALVKKDEAELKLMSDKARELAAELYNWPRLIPRYQEMYRGAVARS